MRSAILLYVRFGRIFYFGDVPALENLVICNSNLIFHPITRLIAESFGANPLEPNTAEEIQRTGEVTLKFFEMICQMDEKTKQTDIKKIVELLKHLHVISEIKNGCHISKVEALEFISDLLNIVELLLFILGKCYICTQLL